MRSVRERHERAQPARAAALVLTVEPLAQLRQSARDALARRVVRDAQTLGDLDRREPVEVAQHERAAVGLLEREQRLGQPALQLDARGDLVRALDRLLARRVRLVRCAQAGVAPRTAREVARDDAHPGA